MAERGDRLGLPARPFLYTLDQLATLLSIELQQFRARHIYYDGRSIGPQQKKEMMARNIAEPDEKPDWRVAERELKRWMKYRGFRFYERGWVES